MLRCLPLRVRVCRCPSSVSCTKASPSWRRPARPPLQRPGHWELRRTLGRASRLPGLSRRRYNLVLVPLLTRRASCPRLLKSESFSLVSSLSCAGCAYSDRRRWRDGTIIQGAETWSGIIRGQAVQKITQPGDSDVSDISKLLRAWSLGDQHALEMLTPIVYGELHRLARRFMKRERPDHSRQATALVNEAYMRLVDYKRMQWQDRAHFFAVSAQVMRRILVEHARRHNLKRGHGVQHVSLDGAAVVGGGQATDLAALDDAMNSLAQFDPRKVQVVKMRFFGGLSVEETAEVLKVSPVTVKRDWRAARTWLYRELTGATNHGPQTLETS